MSNADDLRRLAEEMASAYEERVQRLSAIKQETADLLADFDNAHSEMAQELRAKLAGDEQTRKTETQAEIKERKGSIIKLLADFDNAHSEMAEELRAKLAGDEQTRKTETQAEIREREAYIEDLLADFDRAHQEMAEELRAKLAGDEQTRKTETQAEIREREDYIEKLLADFDKAHKDMADNLRAELAKVKPELEAAESERKAADQAEIRETAAAWKGLLSAMQAARGRTVVAGPVEVEAAVEVKTVEEAIEEPVEEVDEMEEAAAEEEIREKVTEDKEDRILDLLKGNPEGLKMAQIADMLGIENWRRTLIPIMRELFDDGEIRKEGTLYFLSE